MAEKTGGMTKIRLYMGDRAETKQPLVVIVNGQRFDIPRGVETEVPDYVAAAINDSEAARLEEAQFIEKHSRKDL